MAARKAVASPNPPRQATRWATGWPLCRTDVSSCSDVAAIELPALGDFELAVAPAEFHFRGRVKGRTRKRRAGLGHDVQPLVGRGFELRIAHLAAKMANRQPLATRRIV